MALVRVLEPEVMATEEEALDYDALDNAVMNDLFCVDFCAAMTAARPIARAIDLGTGTARLAIALCKRLSSVAITAIELADEMLVVAHRNVLREQLGARITLTKGDAKHTPWERDAFDAVISNSYVHHTPDPAAAFAEMARLTATGGLVFVRDFARPAEHLDVQRIVDMYLPLPVGSGGSELAMHERQRSFFDAALRASLTVHEVRALVAPLGIPEGAVQMTSDRHWTLSHVMAPTLATAPTLGPANEARE